MLLSLPPSPSRCAGQRPYDVAASRGHRQLLWALNPRVPLAALLQQPAAAPAVPRLAALAAAALRRELLRQLGAVRVAGAGSAAVTAAAAAAAGLAQEGGRHSRRSTGAASQEAPSHGAAAHAAVHSRPLLMMARLSGGCGGSGARPVPAPAGECAATCTPAWPHQHLCRHASTGTGGRLHRRNASDSGVVLGAFRPPEPPARAAAGGGGGSLSGSWRGGTAYASLFAGPQLLLPQRSAGPPQLLAAQLSGGSGCTLTEMAAVACSILGCNTATSVTSAAGE